ncbi:MAG: TRAP transporter substrate-binding protein [Spirochaetota bacterium]
MKKISIIVALLISASIFSGCKQNETSETTTLSYSIFFPATHAQAIAAESWAKEIEKKSNGRIKINMFPGGTLTKADETYNGIVSGIADIGMSCFAYTRGRFPLMEVLDLPIGYPDGMTATIAANELYKKMQPNELADVKVLYLHAHGPGLLHTKKPVKSMEDMKRLKVRSTGLSAKVVTALGGIPVAMPQGSTYEALQRGVVDGTFAPIESLKGWKQGEVISHTTNSVGIGYSTGMYVVMNKNKWEALPSDIKDIFTDVSERWIKIHGEAWDSADRQGLEYTKSLKNDIIELDSDESKRWIDAVKPILDEYVQEMRKMDLPGEKALSELQKLIKK